MRLKLTIRQKILYYILGSAFFIFTIVFYFISSSSRRLAYEQSIRLTNSYAQQYAHNIESWINQDFAVTRTLAAAFLEYRQMPFEQWQKLIYPMYNRVIKTTPDIDALWDSWELSNLDSNWKLPYGRHFYIVYKQDGVYKTKAEMRSLTGGSPTYASMKSAAKEIVVEPYTSEFQQGQMITTLSSPLLENGEFIGVIGANLILTRFQQLVNTIKPYPNSYAFLLSYKGVFIAHPDSTIFKKNITEVLPEFNNQHNILAQVQKGKAFNFIHYNSKGDRIYYTFEPIRIGNTQTPWAIGIAVPVTDIMAQANRINNTSFFIVLIGLLIIIFMIYFVSNNITLPIKKITQILNEFAKGKIVNNIAIKTSSNIEISQMVEALNASLAGLNSKVSFAHEIGVGNLNVDLSLLSDEDQLGKSLIEMRDNLRRARDEEEKRKLEEEKKRWTNEGMTKFGEILRQNNNNLNLLSQELIKNLVWYLNAQVGGLFILNENEETSDKTFDMVAMFAYDRNRLMKRSYHFAEGLIGACAAEKDAIILKEVPQDYIEITSGLGGVNPSYIIVVPLIFEEEVMGVIEIASLQELREHEVQFLKDIAKSIASTLHTVKVNTLTSELLTKSKEQAEMMAAQEEEMRQNLEELQATQEEAARKTLELEGLVNALNAAAFVMEYDTKGYVININDSYLNFLGANREDIIGLHHTEKFMSDTEKVSYDKMWSDILRGNIRKHKTRIRVNGQEHLLLETYTPIFDHGGQLLKILKIAMDITNI